MDMYFLERFFILKVSVASDLPFSDDAIKKIGIKISKVIVSAFSRKKANSIIISIGLYYL